MYFLSMYFLYYVVVRKCLPLSAPPKLPLSSPLLPLGSPLALPQYLPINSPLAPS